jgi:hypothetical protein
VLFYIILSPSVSPSKGVGLILQKGIGEELFRFGTPLSVLMYLQILRFLPASVCVALPHRYSFSLSTLMITYD